MIETFIDLDPNVDGDIPQIKEITNTFNIATNNVSGLNEPVKQQQIMNYINEFKIDFFGLSETKLTTKTAKLLWKYDPTYTSWWNCNVDSPWSASVGLIVKKEYAKYVQEVNGYKGRVIYMKLYMQGRFKLMIIQVYIHANDQDKKDKLDVYRFIDDLLKSAKKDQFKVIIMGDFNADPIKLDNARIHWRYD